MTGLLRASEIGMKRKSFIPLNDPMLKKAEKMYKEGFFLDEIEKRIKISRASLRRKLPLIMSDYKKYARKHKKEAKRHLPNYILLNDPRIIKAKKMFLLDNKTIKQIGKEIGISSHTLRHKLRKIMPNYKEIVHSGTRPIPLSDSRVKKAKRMFEKGAGFKEIEKRVNISETVLIRCLPLIVPNYKKHVEMHKRVKIIDYSKIKKDKETNIAMAKVLGHLLGDGSINNKKHYITYTNRNLDLIKDFVKCIKKVYGVEYKIYKRPYRPPNHKKCYIVAFSAKYITSHLYKKLCNISLKTKKEKAAFLQALFDDEGTIPKSDGRISNGAIVLSQINKENIYRIKGYLEDIGIKTAVHLKDMRKYNKNCKTQYVISIYGQENIRLYKKLIRFHSKEKQKKLENYCKNVKVHYPKYPLKLREKAIELRKKGYSTFKIAKILNVKRESIGKWTQYLGMDCRRKYSQKTIEKAIELRKNKRTIFEIEKILGMPYGMVSYWTKHLNIRNLSWYPEEIKEKGIILRKAGLSTTKIAEVLNVSNATVSHWTQHLGINLRYKRRNQKRNMFESEGEINGHNIKSFRAK